MTAPPPRAVRWIDLAVEVLLYALLAFLPAAFGAVDAWSEFTAVCAGATIAACLAARVVLVRPGVRWTAVLPVALFLGICGAQLVPLPRGLVPVISPATAATRIELLDDLPNASQVLARMPLSLYGDATRHDLKLVLLAVVVFAAVVTLFREPLRIRRLLFAVSLIGAAVGALALAQDVTHARKQYWHFGPGDFPARSGPFVNHSHFGQFMNLSIGCALALLLLQLRTVTGDAAERRRRSLTRFAAIVWLAGTIVLGLATLALSLTRGGLVGAGVGGTGALLVMLTRRNLRAFAGVVLVLGLLALGALTYYGGIGRVYGRWQEGAGGGIGIREQMVRDVAVMVRRFPLAGTGLGTFEWVYPAYDRTNTESVASHAEDEYAQAAAETGLPGLAAVLMFVAVAWTRYARALRPGSPTGVAAVGLGFGLLAVMVHSLSDFGQHIPSDACLSAVTCGLLFNLGPPRREGRRVPRAVSVALALAVIAVGAWAVIDARSAWRGEAHWSTAERRAARLEQRDWEATPAVFEELFAASGAAIAADPGNAHYRYWDAVYHWRQVARQPRESRAAGAEEVLARLNVARTLCPTYGLIYSVLGQIEYGALGRAIGITHVHTASRLAPNDSSVLFIAGRLEARRGDWAAAEPLLRRAIRMNGDITPDVIDLCLTELDEPRHLINVANESWSALMLVSAKLDQTPKYHALAPQPRAMGIELLEQICRQPDVPAYLVAQTGGYLLGSGRLAEADAYYRRAISMDPNSANARLGYAETLLQLGRVEEARQQARVAQDLAPDRPDVKAILERLSKMK